MRLSTYSLKTAIIVALLFILFSGMLLLDIVMVKITERDLLRAEIKKGIMVLRTIEQDIICNYQKQGYNKTENSYLSFRHLRNLLNETRFSTVIIFRGFDEVFYGTGMSENDKNMMGGLAKKAIVMRDGSLSVFDARMGILPFKKGNLFLTAPVGYDGKTIGAASICIPLKSMYETIGQSQKIIFSYILLNVLFLTMFGFYLFYRGIIKPINQLTGKAGEFKGNDALFLFSDAGRNEFGKLSKALNLVITGLEDKRKELNDSIKSLEKTNVELQQAQEEIVRSEKLASVGRLASGVAHEIGNPIGIVLGYLGLVKGDDLSKEQRDDFIERIENEVDRINRIIRDLLDFSRMSKGEQKDVSVHQTIAELLDMLSPQPMMSDVQVIFDRQAVEDTVFADPDKLKQLVLNILMNALDALQSGSKENGSKEMILSVKTAVLPGEQQGKDICGSKFQVEISDNGPGINPEDLGKIFDPFYTTKEPGKGTGLGLSVSLRIVEDMGGDIRIKSEGGKGTIVTVVLPLASNVSN